MNQFQWYRRLLGGKWYLCELPGYDCGGYLTWRRDPNHQEIVRDTENW